MLSLQAGPQAEGHAAAAARGEILTGPAPVSEIRLYLVTLLSAKSRLA